MATTTAAAPAPDVVVDREDSLAGGRQRGRKPQGATGSQAGSADSLLLPDVGNPLVQVRRHRRVDLYDEPGGSVIKTVRDETEFGSPTAFAVQRRRNGWAGVPTPYFENGRLAWVRLDPRRLKAYAVFYEVEVDLSDYQATLLRRDKPISTFPVSIGMPEAPTPTGHFAVTDTFRGGLNPALRLLRGRADRAPDPPSLRLARRRPDRDPRHLGHPGRRDLALAASVLRTTTSPSWSTACHRAPR